MSLQRRSINESEFLVDNPILPDLPVISTPETPVANPNQRLPKWLKRQVPKSNADNLTSRLMEELGLETVCDNAKCPNRMECYSQQTATFMILGNVCTRPCSFCAVSRGRPEALEADEPERVAEFQ